MLRATVYLSTVESNEPITKRVIVSLPATNSIDFERAARAKFAGYEAEFGPIGAPWRRV